MADPRSFMRGLAYQQQGRVEVEAQSPDVVTATVRGSMPYRVELRRAPRLSWSCTCPVGEDGDFCKHCVAVALQVTADEPERRHPRQAERVDGPDLVKYLSGLESEELVDLLREQVESDWRLRERLTARALASGGGSLDARSWKQRIDAVFGDSRDFVPYTEAGGWAQTSSRSSTPSANSSTPASRAVVGLAEHAAPC